MDSEGQKALCVLLVTDLPSPPPTTHPITFPSPPAKQTFRSPGLGGSSSWNPAAARPLAAGSIAWAYTESLLPSSLSGPAPGTSPGSPGSSAARLRAPASPDLAPSDDSRLRPGTPPPGAGEVGKHRDSGWAPGSPAPAHLGSRPPRGPPLLGQRHSDSGVAAGATASSSPGDHSPNPTEPSRRHCPPNSRAPTKSVTHNLRLCLFCPTQTEFSGPLLYP